MNMPESTVEGGREPVGWPGLGDRHWHAELELKVAPRGGKSALVCNRHHGPLRVQRPFYPEANGCCHIYLLHPPGGMVLGDHLCINAAVETGANALITTPSAGKIYGVQGSKIRQRQDVSLAVAAGSCMEWLPQETIVFDGANGHLQTTLNLSGNAKACLWDIVCLGRVASSALFHSGQCQQNLTVIHDGKPILIERNRFVGGSRLLSSPWGLSGAHTVGTFVATAILSRNAVDELLAQLNGLTESTEQHRWGATQKGDLFIVRYLGVSSLVCRKGFAAVWRWCRPWVNGQAVVTPRIWNT